MPTSITMSPELLVGLLSSLTSLVFGYFPKVSDWYNSKTKDFKSLLMIILLVAIAVSVFLANCGQFVTIVNLTCTKQGALDVVWYLLVAITTSQGTFLVAVRPYQK